MPERLRIALLDSWWRGPARGSGTTVAISGLAGGLAALGHAVTPLAPRWGAPGHIATRLVYNLALPGRIQEGGFDLVLGFDWDGFRYRPDTAARYVVGVKGVLADEARFEHGPARLRLALQERLERSNVRHAGRVVATSRYSKERLCAAYGVAPEKVVVVPEGIDLSAWRGPDSSPAPRPPTILSVARQYPRKNTRTLVAAMPAVRRKVPEARLRIVGGGPELPALRRQVRRLGLGGCVTLLGALPDVDRVRAEYAAARVFCLPSLQEGFGIVYLEAMATGLPVVAGDVAAVPEVVPRGEAGLLVPPRDAAALAAALVRLLTDPALAARLGAAGRARAEAHAWPTVARRFLKEVTA